VIGPIAGVIKWGPRNGPPAPIIHVPEELYMRIALLLSGLLIAASPALAQSLPPEPSGKITSGGVGNYNSSGSYGGKKTGISIMGDTTDMGLGSSSMGNGSVGTSYGLGSRNAGSGLAVDGSGFSDGMSSLPAAGSGPTTALPYTGKTHPMK